MNKGYQMTFKNGWTISVQWGAGSYCENRSFDINDYKWREGDDVVSSPDAEIAIWNNKGEWYEFESDCVKGWCSADEVAEWIEKVSKW